MDLAEQRFMRQWDIHIPIEENERWVLKFADMFEFAIFCKEEMKQGNTHAHSRYMRAMNICKTQIANAPSDKHWKVGSTLVDQLEIS